MRDRGKKLLKYTEKCSMLYHLIYFFFSSHIRLYLLRSKHSKKKRQGSENPSTQNMHTKKGKNYTKNRRGPQKTPIGNNVSYQLQQKMF